MAKRQGVGAVALAVAALPVSVASGGVLWLFSIFVGLAFIGCSLVLASKAIRSPGSNHARLLGFTGVGLAALSLLGIAAFYSLFFRPIEVRTPDEIAPACYLADEPNRCLSPMPNPQVP